MGICNRIELLAPAGNREALHAAVENGADAVYLGGKLFSARAQADNFDMAELKEELEYAHVRGVNIYLALNTLVSDDEMRQALTFAAEAREAGIDGIIVQDLGLAAALRRVIPDVPLHGSTQMTIYDIEGVRVLEAMGFNRIVLARELTLSKVSEIARSTRLEVEIFVHGALCVCYSGQCLMSSMIGGRSGNRGKCAQPCRMPYRLTGSGHNNLKPQYILSPKDICTLEYMPEIAGSGIRSLKIEGRMKSAEYVATVVRIYRKYLDYALKRADEGSTEKLQVDDRDMHDLLQIYNRGGFSAGYLKGKTGSCMMSFKKPNNSGIFIGNVIEYDKKTQTVAVRLNDRLSTGDGIEIWTGGFNSPGGVVTSITRVWRPETGDRKFEAESRERRPETGVRGSEARDRKWEAESRNMLYCGNRSGTVLKTADKGDLVVIGRFSGKISPGDEIYKTTDAELNKSARESFTGKSARRVEIKGRATLKSGRPLSLEAEDQERHIVSTEGTVLPEKAINKPLTEERLRSQLSKTGSTPFDFTQLQIELEDGLSLPIGEINEVRRQVLDKLFEIRAGKYAGVRSAGGVAESIEGLLKQTGKPAAGVSKAGIYTCSGDEAADSTTTAEIMSNNDMEPAISLYFYKWNQDTDYAGLGADRLYLPFEAIEKPGFADIVTATRQTGVEVFGWLPAVTWGNCEKLIDKYISARDGRLTEIMDGLLVGGIGAAGKIKRKLNNFRLAGDISLNLFNSLSVREAAAMGLESISLSVEMNLKRVEELAYDNTLIMEVAVYGRLPLMISEYCPAGCVEGGFNASSRCGGCCVNGDYKLQDRMGLEFPVLCDRLDCRSTILNSKVLFVPKSLERLRKANIKIFRLYIWDESPEMVKELVQLYRACARGDRTGAAAYSETVERIRAYGFTRGSIR